MAVTNDEYELPILVCDTAKELAKKIGVKHNTISVFLWREKHKQKVNWRSRKYKYERVVYEE